MNKFRIYSINVFIYRRKQQREGFNKTAAKPGDRGIAGSSDLQNHGYANVRMSDLVGSELDDNQASGAQQDTQDSEALYSNNLVKERKMEQRQKQQQQENASHNDAPVYENERDTVSYVPMNAASAISYDTLWKSGVIGTSDDTYNHLDHQTTVPQKKTEPSRSVDLYNHLYGGGEALTTPAHAPTSVEDNAYSLAKDC